MGRSGICIDCFAKKNKEEVERKGIVYLIQPAIYNGTKYYKVGMSKKENIDRIKSYKLHTRVLCIYNCKNPIEIEKSIIEVFTKKFQVLEGREYFIIEHLKETEIQKLFMDIINSQ